MKNDDEMYLSVLSRREEYHKKKERRILALRRTVPVLACFCFAAVFGLVFWDDIADVHNTPLHTDIVEETLPESRVSTVADDTAESSSEADELVTDAVSTVIPEENTEKNMAAVPVKPQPKTAAADVSVGEPVETAEPETIANTEAQAQTEDKKPNTAAQTTSPVTYTQPVTAAQTSQPSQMTVEIDEPIVNIPEPTVSGTIKPSDDIQSDSPIDFEPTPDAQIVQPLWFDDISSAADAIRNNDLPSYSLYAQQTYLKMFERFRSYGFVYKITESGQISLRQDRSVYLCPYDSYDDIGIGYYAAYKGKSYHVMFYCADPYVIDRTDGIADYLKKRTGRQSTKRLVIQGKTVSEYITGGGRILASSFIDQYHYYDIAASVSEEEMIEFLKAFSYEKVRL